MIKLPQAFIEKFKILLKDQANDFFDSFQKEAVSAYRFNPLKNLSSFTENFKNDPVIPWNERFGRYGDVSGKSDAFLTGAVYSQDASAQFVGQVVDGQAGEKILDLAAAPGGKSTEIAASMHNKGLLVANEIDFKRAKILSQNIERSGICNTLVTNHSPEELLERLPGFFDKVLLDAPCSGEGMFRKDPDAIKYWNPEYNRQCAERQKEILRSTIPLLRDGGTLIYSTCTFSPEEDEQVISWILQNFPQMKLLPIQKFQGVQNGRPDWSDGNSELLKTARIWPHKTKAEGHFIAKLVKAADQEKFEGRLSTPTVSLSRNRKNRKKSTVSLEKNELKLLSDFFDQAKIDTDLSTLAKFGDHVYSLPDFCPDLDKIKILRAGLEIGYFRKNIFYPSHALALSSLGEKFYPQLSLDDHQLIDYVHGDVIRVEKSDFKKGWILLKRNNNGLGWGRFSDGMIKNFYPKGLRTKIFQTEIL